MEILCSVLSGATPNPTLGGAIDFLRERHDCGHFVGALNISAFGPVDGFKASMDVMIRALKACPTVTGKERVYVHGELEAACVRDRMARGVPLHDRIAARLRERAKRYGIECRL